MQTGYLLLLFCVISYLRKNLYSFCVISYLRKNTRMGSEQDRNHDCPSGVISFFFHFRECFLFDAVRPPINISLVSSRNREKSMLDYSLVEYRNHI